MRLTVELTYPASVESVAAMLADAQYVRWRSTRSATAPQVAQADLTGTVDTGFTVVTRRTLASDAIPAQARPFVGDHLEIRHAEVWEPPTGDHLVGTVALEIAGAPVRVTGTVRLEPVPGDGARQVYDGEVRATVPLFGAVVEQAAANAVRSTLLAEGQAGIEWLTGANRS